MRLVRGDGERQERVVLGLAGLEAGEAQRLGGAGTLAGFAQVVAFGPEARVELHLFS